MTLVLRPHGAHNEELAEGVPVRRDLCRPDELRLGVGDEQRRQAAARERGRRGRHLAVDRHDRVAVSAPADPAILAGGEP